MAKIEGVCREIMDKADWISISTEGADGPHVAATWGDYVRKLGFVNDETILVPLFGLRTTERNLLSDDRIELLCATKLVPSAFSLGRGCRIRGKGHIETSGEHFTAAKEAFSWARGVLVVKVEGTPVRRNLCMWNALHNYHGAIDLGFVKMLWRFPSQPPDSPILEEGDVELYATKGLGWDVHIGNLGNGMVGVMQPDNGDKGLYYAAVGPVARQAEPLTAGWHYYPIAVTHTFYELQLASKPNEIANAAKERAQYDL